MLCTSILFGLTQALLLDPIELRLSASWQTQPASCFSQLICQVFTYSTGSTSNPYNFSFQCIWNMFERMVNNILLTHKQISASWPANNGAQFKQINLLALLLYLLHIFVIHISRSSLEIPFKDHKNMSLNFPLLVFICYFTLISDVVLIGTNIN